MIKTFRLLHILTIVLAITITSCQKKPDETLRRMYINSDWNFGNPGSDVRMSATVPGCFHLDLINHGRIPDPFYSGNERSYKIQELERLDWVYETRFDIPAYIYNQRHIEINFEGLDTYAEVYLNNQQILVANNMFRKWQSDVTGKVLQEGNLLRVVFRSPVVINEELDQTGPYRLPDRRGWTRKAPYQFGWDWGPRLVTSGIWKPVYLESWDDLKLEGLICEIAGLEDARADCRAIAEVEADTYHQVTWKLYVNDHFIKSKKLEIRPGDNIVTIPFEINDPELWWPIGMGEQALYDLKVRASVDDGETAEISTRFGLREVELVREPDEYGETFYFKVNGEPVFARGANYIPQDNFPSRVTKEDYRALIRDAADANMNMLRVWGGGIYENDIFYELCDETGIMVWQDFMFACNMYPGDPAFLENVRREAVDQVKRLRNHPSIVLWCGNNEVDEGWHNWGWQKQLGYSEKDSTQLWEAYRNIFNGILPDVIRKYDNSRPYWPSSPSIGWGHPESLTTGDSHYWGVWWGEEPFEIYREKTGRFMSEYGFQGYPSMALLDEYLEPEEMAPNSGALQVHQKHPRGMELIDLYMARDFPAPDNFVDYQYVSQLVQAYGITTAIDAHRRAKPYCMGTLYWQLNDCWPSISWSGIDYKGNWKALHYHVKKAYDNLRVSAYEQDDSLYISCVSDLRNDVNMRLDIAMIDFGGAHLWMDAFETVITHTASLVIYRVSLRDLLSGRQSGNTALHIKYAFNGQEEHMLHFFVKPVKLKLPEPGISLSAKNKGELISVIVKADSLARYVRLNTDIPGHFSDNYFDLAPGEQVDVIFSPDMKPEKMPEFGVTSLYDVFSKL